MPKVDAMMKMLFESDEAVADVFNAVFGGGCRLIDASMVHPASEHALTMLKQDNEQWMARERICDVVRRIQWDDSEPDSYFLLGIENQLNPHLLMPWRVMEMQDLTYWSQLRETIRQFSGENKPMDKVEFLSAVARSFRFNRIVTLVIYWGNEPWCVPRQFAELLKPTPFTALLPFEPRMTYPLLIPSEISPKIIDGMEKFLKLVIKYVCASKDKGLLQALLEEYPEYQRLPRNLAQGLLELTGCLWQVDEKKETVNMCKAIDDWMKEEREEGRDETVKKIVLYLREKSLTEDTLREFLAEQMKYSPEQIAEICAVH
ncbi:MAG: hypothetical protein IJJ33_10685 [Victivallales bacterium]|nr:hypothetical protein [Victivallales bacterium]